MTSRHSFKVPIDPMPPEPSPPIEPVPPTPEPQRNYKAISLIILLVAILPIALFAVFRQTRDRSKGAYTAVLGSVHIDPGQILADPNGKPVYMSTLAYDTAGQPVWSGVSYTWGISSKTTVGSLIQNPGNDKIATFYPLNVGTGDLFVTATNTTSSITGSIPVYVGVTPTPTPTPTPTMTPTPTPVPGALLNGSFEVDSNNDGVPDSWSRSNQGNTSDVRTNALYFDGKYSFKFTGQTDKVKTLTQSIVYTWNPGTQLFIGGWLKTLSVTKKGVNQITVVATYSDKTSESFTLLYPTGTYDWTYRLGSLRLSKTTTSLKVKPEFSKEDGEGYYDLVTLSQTLKPGKKVRPLAPKPASAEELE